MQIYDDEKLGCNALMHKTVFSIGDGPEALFQETQPKKIPQSTWATGISHDMNSKYVLSANLIDYNYTTYDLHTSYLRGS
jgi:hypothetical protein